MTPHPNAAPDVTSSRDASSASPLDRRTTSSTFSSSRQRRSFGSSETGESSTAVSNRNSFTVGGLFEEHGDGKVDENGELDVPTTLKDGRGSHRSHRSRTSGGFLLSNAVFDHPSGNAISKAASGPEHNPRQRTSVHDPKGKAVLRSPEKKHTKKQSNPGPGVGGSPLATNVTNASREHDINDDKKGDTQVPGSSKDAATGLDVDSAQIVNLALNLSESRRNAARRNASSPIPPVSQGFGESLAGGSLRQHLQQQRRVSRNVSPKPDRGERAMAASGRIASGPKINSPLQAAFEPQLEGQYQYRPSASTLARVEKAKNAIELMAQYRRLLQYVPPLKPQIERVSTASDVGSPGSAISSPASRSASASISQHPLGRPYNPLQYIRNRKVRARNSKAIDGEAQGFGDVDKVSSWVEQVSKEASNESQQVPDRSFMPWFSRAADAATSPKNSPQSSLGKSPGALKAKRPRIDWVTNPADMLADIVWLEQDDNKKLIEDSQGRRIFPQKPESRRPISRKGEEPELRQPPSPLVGKDASAVDLRIETKLPEFKSIKSDSEKHSDSAASRARQKLREVRDATRIHHNHNATPERPRLLRSGSRSLTDSSDSDSPPQPRRRRRGTTDSHDHGTDILEKQMMEMLAKEEQENDWSKSVVVEGKGTAPPPENKREATSEALVTPPNGSSNHSRSGSVVNRVKKDSLRNGSSGRASLEVPSGNRRRSLEELDSTAPNSPEAKASRLSNAFIPSIAMDLSPPPSRSNSQTRSPLFKAKSKILPFREHSRERGHAQTPTGDAMAFRRVRSNEDAPESPDSPDVRRRSMSPVKLVSSRKTDESLKPLKKTGSLRKNKGEDSGIRGLFKGTRNPVARVSDFLWKSPKDSSHGTSSGFSTDESDLEDFRVSQAREKDSSRESSAGNEVDDNDASASLKVKPSYLGDMPTFTSPFERRGRPTRARSDEVRLRLEEQYREERRSKIKSEALEPPPRIDVQTASPTSSPDTHSANHGQRDSSVSDLESRRNSFEPGVRNADARLNTILGLPGQRRNALPMTGLTNLETTPNIRPSLESRRQWSISDRDVSLHRGPMTKREIARIRALLLSSGIKAKEISRRAAEPKDLRDADEGIYMDIAELTQDPIPPVPNSQQHVLAARILSNDIQLSSRLWQDSTNTFVNSIINDLLVNVENFQSKLANNLTPMTRKAADEADEVSKDIVTSQTLTVKRLTDKIDVMMRRRRRRFRWLRRGGWVIVEWALVGVMWYVWFMVVLLRIVMGVGRGIVGSVRWLFWL
ncbi:hypothetical protein G7Y89_g1816 [Cudoniella acicularis]|uniref:Uncharacterized protein n=1 Tax=Cudoniella acicularis TaxID=354080 RepID=A0A8H4W7J0_9HELO|nr:hypothetical protein G7Y89_g1816 [Cudoniella acicularis]